MKACIFYFIFDYGKEWKPTLSWYYFTEEDGTEFFEESTITYKYLVVLYNAIIMLKGNELGPRTELELIIGTVLLLLDLIIAG
jgi:hypothetical protein